MSCWVWCSWSQHFFEQHQLRKEHTVHWHATCPHMDILENYPVNTGLLLQNIHNRRPLWHIRDGYTGFCYKVLPEYETYTSFLSYQIYGSHCSSLLSQATTYAHLHTLCSQSSTKTIRTILLVTPCSLTRIREFIHKQHRNTTRGRRPSVVLRC